MKVQPTENEKQIMNLIEKIEGDIASYAIEAIMSTYAPDAIIFDARDALLVDKEGLKAAWQECFDVTDNFKVRSEGLQIKAAETLAFSHCLNHATGKVKNSGEDVDIWIRVTTCYSKLNGSWKIVHEHVSVPGDFTTGKMLQDLKPIFYTG